MGCFKPEKIYKFKSHVMMFHTSHRFMGGAPKPRRRLTPAICADRINELNAEEQKMMLETWGLLLLKSDWRLLAILSC